MGEITIAPGGDRETWRSFLMLLGRTPASVRADGGVALLWAAAGGRGIELQEIDYAEVLRERSGGKSASWETIVAHCVSGGAMALDESAIAELLGIAADPAKVIELMATVEDRTEGGVAAKAASVMRMIRGVVSTVSKKDAERVEPMLRNMAAAVGELSPDLLVGLLSDDAGSADEARVMDAIVSRMTDRTIAHFVSKNVIASNGTPTDRLVEAFQTLVRNPDDRHRLLNLAHADAAASPFGQTEGLRDGVEPRGGKAVDLLLRRHVRIRGLRARAVGRAHEGRRRRAGQRRPSRAPGGLGGQRRRQRAAVARSAPAARSAAARAGRRSAGAR